MFDEGSTVIKMLEEKDVGSTTRNQQMRLELAFSVPYSDIR